MEMRGKDFSPEELKEYARKIVEESCKKQKVASRVTDLQVLTAIKVLLKAPPARA